jgi:adenylate kinase family enzyme
LRRISVVGPPGAGKSRVATGLAARLAVPHVELDAIFHQRNWGELPRDEFRARVETAVQGDGWVLDGNYSAVQDIVWSRADTVVWLDLDRSIVMARLMRRTLGRIVWRRRLWNNNRERWRNLFSRDPQRSILAWTWTRHAIYRERYAAAVHDPAWAHLQFIRFGRPQDLDAFLAALQSPDGRAAL